MYLDVEIHDESLPQINLDVKILDVDISAAAGAARRFRLPLSDPSGSFRGIGNYQGDERT
ncbi:hypothetical protein [Streptomyces sp. NPDC023588]|uniref:hypothetical protein n=1 Tax=Streptomyces sp. NPDC023588 TaxID=3154907 RepID=UPI0033F58C27